MLGHCLFISQPTNMHLNKTQSSMKGCWSLNHTRLFFLYPFFPLSPPTKSLCMSVNISTTFNDVTKCLWKHQSIKLTPGGFGGLKSKPICKLLMLPTLSKSKTISTVWMMTDVQPHFLKLVTQKQPPRGWGKVSLKFRQLKGAVCII